MLTVLTNDPALILTLNTKFGFALIIPAIKYANLVMPDLIRHPEPAWIAMMLHYVPGFRRNETLLYI
jgi:hypothetical protein